MDLSYIQDYNWDKEISKVSIVDGPKGVTCKVYDNEEYQEDEKYTLITVHLGINSNRTDDEGNLPEDIAFNKVNITWDDGSESIEDVGSIVISSDDFDSDMVDESGGSEMGESYISLEPAERDVKITGLKFRVKDAEQYFTDITFNETPLKEISIRRPLELYEGESTDISVLAAIWTMGIFRWRQTSWKRQKRERKSILPFSWVGTYGVTERSERT